MDTQLHLLEADTALDERDPAPSPRSLAPRRGTARPARGGGRPARGAWQLADEVRATGLRGVAEAREALAASRRRDPADEEPPAIDAEPRRRAPHPGPSRHVSAA